jgi:hypothetical protein
MEMMNVIHHVIGSKQNSNLTGLARLNKNSHFLSSATSSSGLVEQKAGQISSILCQ